MSCLELGNGLELPFSSDPTVEGTDFIQTNDLFESITCSDTDPGQIASCLFIPVDGIRNNRIQDVLLFINASRFESFRLVSVDATASCRGLTSNSAVLSCFEVAGILQVDLDVTVENQIVGITSIYNDILNCVDNNTEDDITFIVISLSLFIGTVVFLFIGVIALLLRDEPEEVPIYAPPPQKKSSGLSSTLSQRMNFGQQRLSGGTAMSPITPQFRNSLMQNFSETDSIHQARIKSVAQSFATTISNVSQKIKERFFEVTEQERLSVEDIVEGFMPYIKKKLVVRKKMRNKLPKKEPLKKFTLSARPTMELDKFLVRLIKGINLWFTDNEEDSETGSLCLCFALAYIQKLLTVRTDFDVIKRNVHQLFAAFLLVSIKFTEDNNISYKYWSKVTGIEQDVLIELEEVVCLSLDFDFNVELTVINEMFDNFVINRCI